MFSRESMITRLLFGAVAVLVFHTEAQAQQNDPEAPSEPAAPTDPRPIPPPPPAAPPGPAGPYSPEYGGAPGYPPSYDPAAAYGAPPGYAYHPSPYYVRQAAPAREIFRPFTIGLGVGMGALSWHTVNDSEGRAGLSYTARLGVGFARNWVCFLGVEGTSTGQTASNQEQTAYLVGAQGFFFRRLFLRGALGLAHVTDESDRRGWADSRGHAFMGGAGVEIVQGHNTSLAVELAATVARYPGISWYNSGLNMVINFF